MSRDVPIKLETERLASWFESKQEILLPSLVPCLQREAHKNSAVVCVEQQITADVVATAP